MNLGELLALSRQRLFDTTPPYLWSDEQLIDYTNAAVLEALERSRLKFDRSTTSVTSIPISAGTRSYALDPAIQSIRRVIAVVGDVPEYDIPLRTIQDLIVRVGVGWALQEGDPYSYWVDPEGINVYPMPLRDYSLKLEVFRRAMDSELLVLESDIPALVPAQFHRDLVFWVLKEAYSIHDADVENLKRADRNEMLFEKRFGYRPSAKAERFAATAPLGAPIYNQRFGGI